MAIDTQAVWKLVAKYGPRAVAAYGTVTAFLKSNPAIPTWLRKQLDELPKLIDEQRKKRGDAARIRGMLGVIREVADELEANDGAQYATRIAGWRSRADNIERAVRLAEVQPQPERRQTLARLRADTGDLLADLIEVTTGRPVEATAPPEALPTAEP